jgi:hypothetical protein
MKVKMQRLVIATLASLACAAAGAQAVSPEKQKLIDHLLTLWHVEETALVMVQRPAVRAMEQSRVVLQGRVSAPKQEATLREVAADVQKYVDEATPLARASAVKLKAPTLAPILAQNFNEDELKQLIALLESPVRKKFEQLTPQMEKAFGEKVAADAGPAIDPMLKAMTESVGLKLRAASMAP